MKKILVTLFFGFLSIAAFSNFGNKGNFDDPLSRIDVKKMNVRAVKDFNARYGHSGEAIWYTNKDGFVSYFTHEGYINRVYYGKKGDWIYSLLFYGENKLNREVRAVVKSNYFDQNITLVEEVQTTSGLVYVITLEDKTSIKILKINNAGEMEIIQQMVKL